jgi:cytochrome c peroxidase
VQKNKPVIFFILFILIFLSFSIGISAAGELEPIKTVPISRVNPQTPEKIELGKILFFDRRLSGDGTMSCATCHIPDLGFTDGQAISMRYPTTKHWRNAQTVLNSAFFKTLFHDGRSESLEDQALFPILSAFEMNQNLDFLEEEIRAVPEYLDAFREAFGTDDITRQRIAMALAAFERTLISRNAPIDKYLSGYESALSSDAKEGMEIFTGKGKCSECHFGPALIDNKYHSLNVPENVEFEKDPRVAAARRFVAKFNHFEGFRTLKEDPGRYLITKDPNDWKAFRTPTLREISRTAPYMHNGIFETLEEVIEFFDRGGGEGNTALKPLGLSKEEKKYLEVFLTEALTGDEIVVKRPHVP